MISLVSHFGSAYQVRMMSMQAERIAQVMRLRSEDLERRLEAGGDADASVLVGCPLQSPPHTHNN